MRVMCFGDSNTFGTGPDASGPQPRQPPDVRWPCVMAASLGCELVEEGLPARTTDIADPTRPELPASGFDGSAYLPAALASHLPLDWVVLMLGTNDCKAMFARTPFRIALGAARLVDIVQTIGGGVGTAYASPRALLVCPPPLGRLSGFAELFQGGTEKSAALPPPYAAMATAAGCAFLDAGTIIATDGEDGVHWTAATQRRFGTAVADTLRACKPAR